jgi:hypothetical protein
VDQLCAIGLSAAAGLGYIFNSEHEASARRQIVANNRVHMPPFHDAQKHFFPGDTGITICSYPHGKLAHGMHYDTIVSTGFTYPVVAGLILDRNLEDAEAVAKDIRARHDGRNRSPWNEPECGLLYSRSMAGWNLLDQAVGLKYNAVSAAFGFDPRYEPESFRCFFVAEGGWGEYAQSGPTGLPKGALTMKSLHGKIAVRSLEVVSSATAVAASLDGKSVEAKLAAAGIIEFSDLVVIAEGCVLEFTLSSPVDSTWNIVDSVDLRGANSLA